MESHKRGIRENIDSLVLQISRSYMGKVCWAPILDSSLACDPGPCKSRRDPILQQKCILRPSSVDDMSYHERISKLSIYFNV